MLKTQIKIRELQRKPYRIGKQEKEYRFIFSITRFVSWIS